MSDEGFFEFEKTEIISNPEGVWKEYEQRVLGTLMPMVAGSHSVLSYWDRRGADAKNAIETGFAVLLDKPMVLLCESGVEVSEKLKAVADEIIYFDPDDLDAARPAVIAAVERIYRRLRSE